MGHRKRQLKPKVVSDSPITKEELREWRQDRSWTQEDAASWLCVPHSTYENWERGHRAARHPAMIRNRMDQAPKKKMLV